MKKTTFEWLKAGELDLKTMEKLLDDEFLTSVVAFHAQQLVEKTFKSLFEEKNIDIPKIHSLFTLWKRIAPRWENFPLLNEDILHRLDQLYIDARYPGNLGLLPDGDPSVADAREFYDFSRELNDAIKKILM
ncbi:MAG: HEPN domain-containing protein [Deltaproteobacteria bacterium]|jgi:HEPN domain-containing protein